jgi:putative ABC transport system permease protein
MWRNYLTVAFRSLIKNKTYAFINIFGLALGLAACLMLLLYVRYEQRYDRWIPGWKNIYQVQTLYKPDQSGKRLETQMTAYAAGAALAKDFPQIATRVYMLSGGPTIVRNGEALKVEDSRMVDGPFFDVFHIPLVHGDPATALKRTGSLVLSQSEARRLFGNMNPVGQILSLDMEGKIVDHRVTGVVRDLPRNSHMRFNMLVRFDPQHYSEGSPFATDFGWQAGWVYVALRPGTDPATIHSQMAGWEKRNIPDQVVGSTRTNIGDQQDYRLLNISEVHLGRAQEGSMTPGNDARSILTFAVVALLILGMACVNFINLATARAGQRAREVALRKVLGASRKQLVVQFLGETLLLVGLAMFLALVLTELLLPPLARFLEADLSLTYTGPDGILLPAAILVLGVGAISGLYPAVYLSRYKPAQILKANKSSAEPVGSGRLRQLLVVAQFAVSIGLIVCTAIIYGQTVYARDIDSGFDRNGLIQISNMGEKAIAQQREASDIRRSDRDRHRHAEHHHQRRGGAGPAATDRDRKLRCRCELLQDDGGADGVGKNVRARPFRRRRHDRSGRCGEQYPC